MWVTQKSSVIQVCNDDNFNLARSSPQLGKQEKIKTMEDAQYQSKNINISRLRSNFIKNVADIFCG